MRRCARLAVACLSVLGLGMTAAAQDLGLPKDSEAGFRRLIAMAQNGRLGNDVTNANVSIDESGISVELVRASPPNKLLELTPKRSAQRMARYFDVFAGAGATASDAERVGQVLDEVFDQDPFRILGLERAPDAPTLPTVIEAWGYGGVHGVRRVLEMRLMVLATPTYTIAVVVALVLGLLVSIVVLCFSIPSVSAANDDADSRGSLTGSRSAQ